MKKDRRLFWLALAVVAAQGWVRLAVAPLWQHYDEPSHYEYLRFVVEHGRLPDLERDEADRDILARTGVVVCAPGIETSDPADCLAPGSQFAEMPGYYLLQAFGQWVLRPAAIPAQLQLARIISSALALAVAGLTWWTAGQLFPGHAALAAATTAMLGVVTGYADLMGALNNDVGAVAAMSLMAAAGLSIIRRGVSPGRSVLLFAAVGCCLAAKTTAFIGAPLAALGLGLAFWPRLSPRLRVAAAALGVLAGLLAVDWHLPAGWQVIGPVGQVTRASGPAPLGRSAFQLTKAGPERVDYWQALSPESQAALRGRTATVGAWVRTTSPAGAAPLPLLSDDRLRSPQQWAAPGADWKFYAFQVSVPAGWGTVILRLPGRQAVTVQYDGVVVAAGAFPESPAPIFDDPDARSGTWNGVHFVNLVQNGSAELGWLVARPQVNQVFPWGGINLRLISLYDWRRTWPVYGSALRWQFVTFWTAFATGREGLPAAGLIPYLAFTLAAAGGLVYGGLRAYRTRQWAGWQWRGLAFCAAIAGAALLMSIVRIDPVRPDGTIFYIPSARYFYVAGLPTFLLLTTGWLAWWPPRRRRYAAAAVILVFYGLGVWSLLAVQLPYFHSLPVP